MILLSVFVAFGEASRRLVIIPEEETFVKPLGGSMVLTCKVVTTDGRRPPAGSRLRWLDDNDREIVAVNGRRYVEISDTFKKLYIVDIEQNDAGNYKCLLDARVPLQKSITLSIYQEIAFDRAPANQFLRRHAPGVIQCVVSGQPQPTVSWRFNGSRITTGGRHIIREDGLKFLNVTDSDAGNYTCRAEVDDFGNYAERLISVAVNIPPVITRAPGRRNAIQGVEFFYQCEAAGTPLPTFIFYKDGELLDSDNRVDVNSATGVVRFRTVNKADEGTYVCVASNNVGNTSATGFIKVLVKAAVLEFPDVTGIEGESATLRCRAIGDPVPQMIIKKTDETDPYQLGSTDGGRLVLRSVGRGTLELNVTRLAAEDASDYCCSAVNDVGRSQRTAVLTVHFGPKFADNHSREAYAWEGVSRNISCFPLAEPPAAVEWSRFGQTFVNNDTYKVIRTTSASFLQVYVQRNDQPWIYGMYTCRAQNDFGTKEISINLRRATVPNAPKTVELTESMPDGVVLTLEPPDEDGGMPVIGYRVKYGNDIVTALGSKVVVKNLRPGTTYLLQISSRNEVGFGAYQTLRVTTKSLSTPYAVVIKSPRLAESSTTFKVQWETISTGGLPIIQYEFKYKRVKQNSSNFVPVDSEWTIIRENPSQPLKYFKLHGLQPETDYQLVMRVGNKLGWSNYSSSYFVFHTPEAKVGAAVGNGSPIASHRHLFITVLITTMISLLFGHAAHKVLLSY